MKLQEKLSLQNANFLRRLKNKYPAFYLFEDKRKKVLGIRMKRFASP